ncbi:mothers against decapentaplegic homolog 6-like [Oppia nitens]|uniref:mothers against decapentaplegic homolog 6-like n=1 Tax=Oppia nitens TaxID=1686743 RepID=UPI0023DC9C1E|nr:mothers against decapentaplegic homolog 6-like [Oppia nitens]
MDQLFPVHSDDGVEAPESCGYWCTLAYWELKHRVGRLFPVYDNSINVFAHHPQGSGLWLEQWFPTSPSNRDSTVRRTREKIGCGVTITRKLDGVWLHNRSKYPIFVDSPTMDPPNTRNLTVYKVFPGFSTKVFDFKVAQSYRELTDGPVDTNAFRISFYKGWGSNYSRQYITSCPCWLEVLLTT